MSVRGSSTSRIVFVLLALVAVLFAIPCMAGAVTVGSIHGSVYFGDNTDPMIAGMPIEGITVRLYEVTGFSEETPIWSPTVRTAVTTAGGEYSFEGLPYNDAEGTQYAVGISQGSTDTVGTDYRAYFFDTGAATRDDADLITLGGLEPADYWGASLYPDPVAPSIAGQVTGSDFTPRLPIAGCQIEAYEYDAIDGWYSVAWAETDDAGIYRLWALPAGNYRVGYSSPAPDIYSVRWKAEYWTPAATATGVGSKTLDGAANISFTPGTHISGKNLVLDKARPVISGSVYQRGTSTKIPWADVNLWDRANTADGAYVGAYTDWTGNYAIWDDELPSTPITSTVEFRLWGWDQNYYNNQSKFASATPVVASSSMAPRAGVNGFLGKISPSLEGTVTSPSGDPMPWLMVGIYRASADPVVDGPSFSTFTDEDGHYEYYVYPDQGSDNYKVRFYTGDTPDQMMDWMYDPSFNWSQYLSEWFDNATSFASGSSVVLSSTSRVVASAQLADNNAPSVTGTVRTAAGGPVAGVAPTAWSYDVDWDEYYISAWGTESGADGAYKIYGLGDGTYKVGIEEGFQPNGKFYAASYYPGATLPGNGTSITTTIGATASGIGVTATELPPLVSGRVTNAKTGAAIADPYVSFYTNDGSGFWDWAPGWTETHLDGTYKFYSSTAAPAYRIEFGADGFVPEYYNNKADVDTANDVTATVGVTKPNINAALAPEAYTAMRYDGRALGVSNRYSVAADIANLMTEDFDYTPHIILACGEDRAMADPLAASGLAWAYGTSWSDEMGEGTTPAPILLTPTGPVTPNYTTPAVPKFVLKGIASAARHVRATHRADGVTVHIVGGTASVPDARVLEIRAYVRKALGLSATEAAKAVRFDRLAGANRYENSYLVARTMKARRGADLPGIAFVANGADPAKFYDAMAASPMSAGKGIPIILVQTAAVPPAASKTVSLLGLKGSSLYVVGPTTSVAANVATTLKTTNRIKGSTADQYATARAVADWGIAKGYAGKVTCGITAALPDALGAGPYLGMRNGTMLYAARGSLTLPAPTKAFLIARKWTLRDVFIFGGTSSVTANAEAAINTALRP